MKQPIRSGGSRSLLEERLTTGQLDDLGQVLADAERFLGPDSLPGIADITDFEAASQALSRGWQTIRTSMFGGGSALAERVDCGTVDELMDRMVRNERVVRTAQVSHRDSAVRTVREALADLREVTDTSLVIRAGAEAVCRLGFDRAIVSRVEENTWLTEAIYVDGDSEWAAEILQAGRTMPQMIDGTLPENEVRRRKRPVVVTRVQEREAVHRAVADASLSRSYVAAPLAPSNRVLGFLHADRFFHRGDVTDFDAEVLGLFAQGYSFAIERAMVMEELEKMRQRVRDLGAGLVAFANDGLDLAGLDRPSSGVERAAFTSAQPDLVGGVELTRREYEVFRLMAQGETNHRIGVRLCISEGTVKSHVKHILRKLGAANRAEAVALWHQNR